PLALERIRAGLSSRSRHNAPGRWTTGLLVIRRFYASNPLTAAPRCVVDDARGGATTPESSRPAQTIGRSLFRDRLCGGQTSVPDHQSERYADTQGTPSCSEECSGQLRIRSSWPRRCNPNTRTPMSIRVLVCALHG